MWELIIENRIRFGINIGFEFYSPDEESDTYEFNLNILIIKIGMIWR